MRHTGFWSGYFLSSEFGLAIFLMFELDEEDARVSLPRWRKCAVAMPFLEESDLFVKYYCVV